MLAATWKFYDNIYVHIPIREEDKPNPRLLGKTLYIYNEKFEDLNEILVRYIEPTIMYVQEMQSFRSFRHGDQDAIDRMLTQDKNREPKRIPYYVHVSFERPGSFLLSYLPHKRIKTEPILVSPEGYRFRHNVFTDPEELIKWFKIHFRDPVIARPKESRNQPPSTERESRSHREQQPQPMQHHQQPIQPPQQQNRDWSRSQSSWDQYPPSPMDIQPTWDSNPQPNAWQSKPYPAPTYANPPVPSYGNPPMQSNRGYQFGSGGWDNPSSHMEDTSYGGYNNSGRGGGRGGGRGRGRGRPDRNWDRDRAHREGDRNRGRENRGYGRDSNNNNNNANEDWGNKW
jgi:hypothetical protein